MVFSRWPMRGLLPVADAVLPFRVHMLDLRPVEYAGGLPSVYAGSPFEGRCRVSSWWQIQGDRPGVDVGSPPGGAMQGVFPVTEEWFPPGVEAGAPFGGR